MFGFGKSKRMYLDYASATPVCEAALRAVHNASGTYANPGAIHAEGVAAKRLLEHSRELIAHELAVKARQLIYTSGGTEGNNLAILGFARAISSRRPGMNLSGTHWVVSAIEHPSVLECFGEVERLGGEVTFVDPDARGIISARAVEGALRPETVLVSVQWANHEIGTIQPLRDIARIISQYEKNHRTTILLHSDLGQAPLYLAPHLHTLGVDMATLDSGKLYGPRGVGALYLANRVETSGLLMGGKQERGLRAGTENVALVAGFAAAFSYVAQIRAVESRRLADIRATLAREIKNAISNVVINGDLESSLPHILNISIADISSEYVTLALDRIGVSISTKSACREGEESSSHVVAALGGEAWIARNTLRFSFGENSDLRNVLQVPAFLVRTLSNTLLQK